MFLHARREKGKDIEFVDFVAAALQGNTSMKEALLERNASCNLEKVDWETSVVAVAHGWVMVEETLHGV